MLRPPGGPADPDPHCAGLRPLPVHKPPTLQSPDAVDPRPMAVAEAGDAPARSRLGLRSRLDARAGENCDTVGASQVASAREQEEEE
jgi:hypothetical protein